MSEEVLYYLAQLRSGPHREDAFHSLVELDDSYIPKLIEAFNQEENSQIQAVLVEVIWQHHSSQALPFLQEVLRHPHSEVWKTALDGIVAINRPQGLKILASERARLQALNETTTRERLEWIDEAYEQLQQNLQNGLLHSV
jgi:hypothetical protein